MIRLQQYTPEVYYNQSRDFQFIGRLFDLVMNSIKTNTELIYNVPLTDDTDEKLIDLLAMSLGFKAKHNYSIKQLRAVCSIFPKLLKTKGSIEAITLAGKTLLHSEGISADFECSMKNGILVIRIPQELSDLSLFKDLLTYILPAGVPSIIIRASVLESQAHTLLTSTDKVTYIKADETPTNNINTKLYKTNNNKKLITSNNKTFRSRQSDTARGIVPKIEEIESSLSTKGSFINSTIISLDGKENK